MITGKRSVAQPSIPAGVDRLDAVLNNRIITAATESEARLWWRAKVDAKRVLADTPDGQVNDVAGRLLNLLGAAA